MRTLTLSLALIATSLPAFAGGFSVDLPTLSWPTTVTVSTKDCAPGQATCK